jgi:hypothetical protein
MDNSTLCITGNCNVYGNMSHPAIEDSQNVFLLLLLGVELPEVDLHRAAAARLFALLCCCRATTFSLRAAGSSDIHRLLHVHLYLQHVLELVRIVETEELLNGHLRLMLQHVDLVGGTGLRPGLRIRLDPNPNWIRLQSGQWIRIRIRNPDPGGQK